jgi:lysophospholipase L1-like esterase
MGPVSLTATLSLALLIFNAAVSASISYAALGDSYAAGDGAGSSRLLPNFDITCGRFDEAYPVQVANSTELQIPHEDFQNLACGGASSVSILHSQVPKIGNSDVVTITVGGNEVDFFVVLNACVHQFWPSDSCEEEIAKTRSLIQSSSFLNNFNAMVAQAKKRVRDDALLMLTGYAAFFNEQTEQCNNASFSKKDPSNVLTTELRRDFNKMVRLVNDVIRAAAEAHKATYVDVDRLFEGHRFCEEGVTEPSRSNKTWFFNLNFTRESLNFLQNSESSPQVLLPNPIKDFFDLTKTFHPTSLGHEAIAKDIIGIIKHSRYG